MLRLGTRGSALAQWQAQWVAARLRERGIDVELVPITTTGDRRQEAIQASEGQGLFTKEIQNALSDGRVDLAVHSLKDLPTLETPGLMLAAVPERASPRDVLVAREYASLDALPAGATVGTGSLRRRAQLLHARGDLHIRDIRGNVDTRLRKLDQGDYDALILAEAGLRRLGFDARIAQLLPLDLLLPAVGQGALGLETREDDRATREAVAPLDHAPTHAAVLAERAMLADLQGGCLAPVGGLATAAGDQLTLTGRVIAHDGTKLLQVVETAALSEAVTLGRRVAGQLLNQGAGDLIAASRG